MQDINLKILIDKALDVDPDLRFMALEDYRKYLKTSSKLNQSGSNLGNVSRTNYNGYNALETFIPTLFRLLEDQNSDVQNQAIKSFEPTIRFLSNDSILKIIVQLYTLVLKENAKSKEKGQYKSFTTSIPNMVLRSILDNKEELDEDQSLDVANSAKTLGSTSTSLSRLSGGSVSTKSRKPRATFDSRLSRTIIDRLVPQLIVNDITYDSIEILIDLIKNLGSVFTKEELAHLSLFLIEVSFNEAGIISKRSIYGFGLLFKYIEDEVTVNDAVRAIKSQDGLLRDTIIIKSQLYSVILTNPISIETQLVESIFHEIAVNLKLSQQIDTDEDLDFDKLLEDNLIREDSLTVLNDLVRSNNNIGGFGPDILKVIEFFITYNPLHAFDEEDDDGAMSDFEDDEEEIVFSDEENDNDNQEDDDGSWKLRLKASTLIRSYISQFPDSLGVIYEKIWDRIPIDDKNELVSSEAIKSVIYIIGKTESKQHEHFERLEKKIINKLFVQTQQAHFPKVLQLIESLIRFDIQHLIDQTFHKFEELSFDTEGSLNYLNFYRSVLEKPSFESKEPSHLSQFVIDYVASDLIKSLNNKSFNVIIESIKVSNALVKNPNNQKLSAFQIEQILKSLISKIDDSKIYSGDLVQLSIQGIGEILLNSLYVEFGKIIETFKKCFGFENTVRTNLEVLIQLGLANHPILGDSQFQFDLLTNIQEFILSRDETIHNLTMTLLTILVTISAIDDGTSNTIIEYLLQLLALSDSSSFNDSHNVFEVLTKLFEKSSISVSNKEQIFDSIIKLINSDKIDDDNLAFYALISKLSHQNPLTFDHLKEKVDLNLQISSKVLAIISVENELQSKIHEFENEFLRIVNDQSTKSSQNPDLLFIIQYLGNVGEYLALNQVGADSLLKLLYEPTEDFQPLKNDEKNLNNDDAVKRAAAVAVGKIVKRDVNSQFRPLVEFYQNSSYEGSRIYLVQAFNIILPKLDNAQLDFLWKTVWEVVKATNFEHSICGELRNSGDLLSEIVLIREAYINDVIDNSRYYNEETKSSVYTTIVATKKLFNKFPNEGVLTALINYSIQWLGIIDIDIRQLIVGNLLTGLHNQPDLVLKLKGTILPGIYAQLKALPEFKKIIPMGPYKFVIDEGLEIRKLSYEFLYTLISFDTKILDGNSVDLGELSQNIASQGLADDQSDIIVLASLNLTNLIANHEDKFRELLLSEGGELSSELIKNIKIQVAKKLSAKASAQDVESYEERVQSIIRLTKRIHAIVKSYDEYSREEISTGWSEVIEEIKVKFLVFYNSIE